MKSRCWNKVLEGPVKKADVIALLRSDEPVPHEAKEVIAGLLEGSLKSTRGLSKQHLHDELFVAIRIGQVMTFIDDPTLAPEDEKAQFVQLHKKRGTGAFTPDKLAKEYVSRQTGIPVRQIQAYISQARKAMGLKRQESTADALDILS